MACASFWFGLEPKNLVDENDGDAPRDDLAVDDQRLVHGAVDAVGELGAGILEQEGVVVDPTEAFLQVGHDLLRPYDQDDPPRAADVRTELAATHRGRDQRSGLGDRMDAAEHQVGRRAQAADLVGLSLAGHAPDPPPY